MGKLIDLTGQRFGRWVAIARGKNRGKRVYWVCECDCGFRKSVRTDHLNGGHSRSCGCLNTELFVARSTTHNLRSHPAYRVHLNMKYRCEKNFVNQYNDYGGRGITVCDEWLDKNDGVKNFIEWAESNGYEDGLEIDRIDNDGNYEPSNCRFVTHRENSLNRRVNKNNTSGYVGVTFCNSEHKWKGQITVLAHNFNLGYFSTKKQALEARNKYIIENNLTEYKIQEWRNE